MTVPHLMNCPHSADGWCLDCVVDLGNENWRLRDIARDAAEAATQHQAEVLRLRAALLKIADWDSNWGPFPENNEAWRAMVVVTAREAVPLGPNVAIKRPVPRSA